MKRFYITPSIFWETNDKGYDIARGHFNELKEYSQELRDEQSKMLKR